MEIARKVILKNFYVKHKVLRVGTGLLGLIRAEKLPTVSAKLNLKCFGRTNLYISRPNWTRYEYICL